MDKLTRLCWIMLFRILMLMLSKEFKSEKDYASDCEPIVKDAIQLSELLM